MIASKDDLYLQYFLVCFLYHVGQRKILRDITVFPKNDNEEKAFHESIRHSFGRLKHIREAFNNFYQEANSYTLNTSLVSPEMRKDFIASQETELYIYGISDSIIIAVPLANENENCTPMNSVWMAFIATCGVTLLSLAAEVVLRGGLDVGIAAKIEQNEIYGPALESAYYNESQLAEYPRLLTGGNLLQYIYTIGNQDCQSRFGVVAKGMANICREMIIRDTDGRYMLDFLGPRVKEASLNAIDEEVVLKAYDFVKQQYEYYFHAENEKLSSRYYRLLKYFNSRLSVWKDS